jgi:uncharacterized protein
MRSWTRRARHGARPVWPLAIVVVWAIGVGASPAWARQPAEVTLEPAWIAALRGNYQIGTGRVAFLGGWASHANRTQRLFLEVDGERRRLYALAADRLLTAEGDTLRVVGALDAGIPGLEWIGEGGVKESMPRLDLYGEEEVVFGHDRVALAGSLLLPPGSGPFPAVVLVHGSGPDSREPYRALADHFARNGIAALIYDKRGVGASSGDWRTAGFEELARDALEAVRMLRVRPEIDASMVGLWGISQGGWVAPLAATLSGEVAFIIPVSASGVNPATQEIWRVGNNLRYRELSQAAIGIGIKGTRMLYTLKPLAERGWISLPRDLWFAALDLWLEPADLWQEVRQPVLGIWGEIDGLVPTRESVDIVHRALERAGNSRYTLRVFAGADHSIVQAVEGFQHEPLPRFAYAEDFLEGMTEWIHGLGEPDERRLVIRPPEYTPTRLAWQAVGAQAATRFGQVTVQLPLVFSLTFLFAMTALVSVATPLSRRLRRKHAGPCATDRARLLAGVGSVLALVAVLGWLGTLVATVLEGGDPVAWGHPLGLILARTAAVGSALAFTVLAVIVFGRGSASLAGMARIGYSAAVLVGLTFIGWGWYWHLFPWP